MADNLGMMKCCFKKYTMLMARRDRADTGFLLCALLCLFAVASCASQPDVALKTVSVEDTAEVISEYIHVPRPLGEVPVSSFNEIWAYVIGGNEAALKSELPVSDVVYFGAEVDRYGHLVDVPKRGKLTKYSGRVHVSFVCNSAGLTHFVIEPGSKARATLIQEIIAAAAEYDGLNVDMESVPSKDADNFISFLSELRTSLPRGKFFSVCVPARTSDTGPYSYSRIAQLADRVFVMAYDEHWSTSAPGPVASMNWCRNVATYALKTVGPEKLVMGIPFYGRSWGNTSTSRGLVHSTTERIKKEYGVQDVTRKDGIPTFTYDVLVKVTVFYEDEFSIGTRADMYRKQGVKSIGFWRLGQETQDVWPLLNLNRNIAAK